jgi:hypothetical protein
MFPPQNDAPSDSFLTTPWSLLAAIARPPDSTPAEDAFISTYEICWRPICNFIVAHGYEQREARQIAKRFLACLIAQRRSEPPGIADIPMRTYIRESLKKFLAAETARRNAWRRNSMLE